MCNVIGINSDGKEVVRSVKVLFDISGNKDDKRILEQPIKENVLLLEVEDFGEGNLNLWIKS